jgi:hypothetical protein
MDGQYPTAECHTSAAAEDVNGDFEKEDWSLCDSHG